MLVYEKNMCFLEKNYPEIYQQILSLKETLILEPAKDGNYTVRIHANGKNMYLHSKYNPIQEAINWAEQLQLQDEKICIQIGFGLGYHTAVLVEQISCISKLIVVEPNIKIFEAALRVVDISEWQDKKNIIFIVGCQGQALFDKLMKYLQNYKEIKDAEILEFKTYSTLFQNEVVDVYKQLKDLLHRQTVQICTVLGFNKEWIYNPFKNIVPIVSNPGVNCLYQLFAGKPAIIVSGGPSLDKNIHLIKRAKGKAVIIAGARTLPPLLKQGVKPDLLVSIDPGIANFQLFHRYLQEDIPLVFNGQVHPMILQYYEGPKIVGSFQNKVTHIFRTAIGQPLMELPDTPSVACCSAVLAEFMGCSPIILIGQDLAYTGLKSHCSDAAHRLGEQWKLVDERENETIYCHTDTKEICRVKANIFQTQKKIVYTYEFSENSRKIPDEEIEYYELVRGYDGDIVPTTHQLYTYLAWFKQIIAAAPVEYINATEGGAYIDGATHITFRQAIEEYCIETFNPGERVKEVLARATMEKHDYGNLLNELSKIKNSLHNIEMLCEKGLQNAERLFNYYTGKAHYNLKSLVEKSGRIDEQIGKEPALSLLNILAQPVLLRTENMPEFQIRAEDDEKAKGRKNAEKSALIYGGLGEAAKELREQVEHNIKEVEQEFYIKVFECTFKIFS